MTNIPARTIAHVAAILLIPALVLAVLATLFGPTTSSTMTNGAVQSDVYRDGYVWLVDDTKHTTSWYRLTNNGSLASPDRYNPPNRVCLRDIVCIEIGIPTEDGHRVLPSFYSRVTTTGATQARCDYLGKRRVPDATYGHRCV